MKRWMTACVFMFGAVSATARPVIHHSAHISFDLEAHIVSVSDTLTVPDGLITIQLGSGRIMTSESTDFVDAPIDTSEGLIPARIRGIARGDGNRVIIQYDAELFESTADVVFSRENVGREIQATVSDEGIYLSAGSYWLPMVEGAMATHRLTIETPSGWESVTQGRRVLHEDDGTTLTTVWDAVHPSDGLTLVAGPYHVSEQDFDGVTSFTFFLEDEPRLVETYMERTGAYLEMYNEMIGPYPYSKFATVENWFPTGYGMPSYTLLGGTVLRLPFIPFTSFGHEIAHNWWGNSAFVSEDGGNWCEGLTVYCADYHYKELESSEAAREYRRNLLKDYAAYVRDDKDMPLVDFTSRHSGATRAIGYGKSMMVFHMVDRWIGRDVFLDALREVWSSHQYQDVSWNDFMDAFSRLGDVNLDGYRQQWLTRTGAPMIRIQDARLQDGNVHLRLVQDEPVWDLRVPVVVDTADGPQEHILEFGSAETEFTLQAETVKSLSVDPDYHLFRHLHTQEIEPTLSMVFGDDDPAFVFGDDASGFKFAEAYVEEGEARVIDADAADTHSRILINPDPTLVKAQLPKGVSITSGLLFLEGKRYSLKDHAVVLAVAKPDAPAQADLIVLGHNADKVASLGGRIAHYGKYSWLIFPAAGRPLRGNWPVADSPLSRSF